MLFIFDFVERRRKYKAYLGHLPTRLDLGAHTGSCVSHLRSRERGQMSQRIIFNPIRVGPLQVCRVTTCRASTHFNSQIVGYIDRDPEAGFLQVYYRPEGVNIPPQSAWWLPLQVAGLNVPVLFDTHPPPPLVVPGVHTSNAILSQDVIRVVFPELRQEPVPAGVPISGFITAGPTWRLSRAGAETNAWELWWRVSVSVSVRSAITDHVGAGTQYKHVERCNVSIWTARLVRWLHGRD